MAPEVRLRLPEPGSFADLLRPVRIEVASLVRLSRHPATEPFWSLGVYRFDAPEPGHAAAFGTCYTASSNAVAFAESVIHESGRFVDGSYEVPAAELTERWVVRGIRYVSRQMNKGFAYAIFERSGLLKLRAEKLKGRQVDELCDRFNVTAV